jgi:hypothetical protein
MPIESLSEITNDSFKKTSPMKNPKFKIAFGIALTTMTLILFTVNLCIESRKNRQKSPKVVVTEAVETEKETPVETKFLYSKFPNFETLEYHDLPRFSDVRRVFDYNGNKIIMGHDQLIELDTDTQTIVRTSIKDDPDFYTAAKIKNLLYVADNGNMFEKIKPKIYVLDLDTSTLVKTIEGSKDLPFDLTNLRLHSYESDLWISTRYFIIKYDTVTDSVESSYSLKDIGFDKTATCNNAPIMVDEDGVVKVVEFACKNFISTYDYATDTWNIEYIDDLSPSDYINRDANDFDLEIPEFNALSSMVNQKYYALNKKGIYQITKNSLFELIYESEIETLHYSDNFVENSFLFTKDGKEFLFISFPIYIGMLPHAANPADPYATYEPPKDFLKDILTVKKINIVDKTELDLIKDSSIENKEIVYSDEYFNKNLENRPILNDQDKVILLVKDGTITVDFYSNFVVFEEEINSDQE